MVKDPPATAGDAGSMPLLGRSPVEGNGHPLQYSCLKNSMDRSLVGYSLWGCRESNMTENACRHGGPVTLIPLNIYASAVRQQIFDPSHFLKAAKHVSSMVFSEGPLAVMVF